MHIFVINNKVDNDGKYIHQNIPELLLFFCLIFSDNKMLFFGLWFILYVLQLSVRNGFSIQLVPTFLYTY